MPRPQENVRLAHIASVDSVYQWRLRDQNPTLGRDKNTQNAQSVNDLVRYGSSVRLSPVSRDTQAH